MTAACSPSNSAEPCGPNEPAFDVQITAGDGDVLPEDTKISVRYLGVQREAYSLSRSSANRDVCCQAGEAIAGELPRVSCSAAARAPDAGPVTAIQCSLWTGGPADVLVEATGYADLPGNLNSQLKENRDCGVKTKEAWLNLVRHEGGVGRN